jgi:hypothetical protein
MKLIDYDTSSFNAMPSLNMALNAYNTHKLDSIISTSIRDILLKHGAHSRFALNLIHRHFTLHSQERNVHVNNIALPWDAATMPQDILERTVPILWRFSKSGTAGPGLLSCEFEYEPRASIATSTSAVDLSRDEPFLTDLYGFLAEQKLTQYLGISRLSAEDKSNMMSPTLPPIEITEGRANITFPAHLQPQAGKAAQVSWRFDENQLGNTRCVSSCQLNLEGSHLRWHDEESDDDDDDDDDDDNDDDDDDDDE